MHINLGYSILLHILKKMMVADKTIHNTFLEYIHKTIKIHY